jgi:hypothetical protein
MMPKLPFLLLLGLVIAIGGCSTKVVEDDITEPQIEKVETEPSYQRQHVESKTPWRGFNALQTSKVAWNSPAARTSLLRMVALGANSVALIPFLKQSGPNSTDIQAANNVTDVQLIAAIRTAHQLGLRVIVKPQILVKNSWAGEISLRDHDRMHRWFESYSAHMLKYAILSEKLGVEVFVIGTELSAIAQFLPWPKLISKLRKEFKGKLTYAAHNVEGVERFPYWHKLDVIGVSLYPSLGDTGEYNEMSAHVEESLYKLSEAVKVHSNKEVWLLEIGMPSAEGFCSIPWAWKELEKNPQQPDMSMQTNAVAAWLNATNEFSFVDGILFWNWFSDPQAGGEYNCNYTVQNKPAEALIKKFWKD